MTFFQERNDKHDEILNRKWVYLCMMIYNYVVFNFLFSPPFGEDEPICDEHIFQMGAENLQPDDVLSVYILEPFPAKKDHFEGQQVAAQRRQQQRR